MRSPLPLLLVGVGFLVVPAPAGAAPAALKDPQYEPRYTAFKRALRPPPPPGKDEGAPPAAERVAAVKAFAGTRDARVFDELLRALPSLEREAEKAAAALDEATAKLEQVRNPHFQQMIEEYERTGKMPDTILVSLKNAIETLEKKQAEAAGVYDLCVRVRDAVAEGMGSHLVVLGPERAQVWKEASRLGATAKDPADRAAFCEALRPLDGPDVEAVLLSMEADPEVPVVVAALGSLAARRSPAGLERLLKRLDSPDWTVSCAAVHGIARYRDPRVLPALVARLLKSEGRVFADLVDVLFELTGKHVPDAAGAWDSWWKTEGEKFLVRWSPETKTRLDEIERISLADPKTIDVAAELAALLPHEPDAEARKEILGSISIHPGASARAALLKALWDPDKELRVSAVNYLGNANYRHLAVPGELMRRVDVADDEELRAVHRALRTLWGGDQEFGVACEKEALQRWWDTNKEKVTEKFARLGAQDLASGRRAPRPDEAEGIWKDRNFYGLRVISDRVLFIVDFSLSMNEPAKKGNKEGPKKIDVARGELSRAIKSLDEKCAFGVLAFAATEELWETGMVAADTAAKKRATEWVAALKPRLATNIYDAMEAAFVLGTTRAAQAGRRSAGSPDTIFFVSDGAATAGKFTKSSVILDYIRRWNKNRGVKIHAIGVGDDHDVNFLRALAEENGGTYVAR